jgi:hypothetical protein
MVSPISRITVTPTVQPAAQTSEQAEKPGKSAGGVGQQAKAAIAESGLSDLPRNIQGKVASMIARGLDVTALLAPPPPPPPSPDTTGDAGAPVTGGDEAGLDGAGTLSGTPPAVSPAPPVDTQSSSALAILMAIDENPA